MNRPTQLTLGFGFEPSLGDADFLVADCNREAVAWLDRWPDWPAPALILHGPQGCGKTHLARAFMARRGGRLIGAVDLGNQEPSSLLGPVGLALVENAEEILARSPALEKPLLHLYNTARDEGGHLLLTARTPPARWNIALPDLASRLKAAPLAAIGEPDQAVLAALLVKLFADRQIRVEPEVIPYLTSRMERSFRAAGETVAAIDKAALTERRNITLPFVRRVLTSEMKAEDPADPAGRPPNGCA